VRERREDKGTMVLLRQFPSERSSSNERSTAATKKKKKKKNKEKEPDAISSAKFTKLCSRYDRTIAVFPEENLIQSWEEIGGDAGMCPSRLTSRARFPIPIGLRERNKTLEKIAPIRLSAWTSENAS